ncbi:hypothetical protein AB0D54_26335 [Streptomyces xanthophaeus]|uniref:hypothetical protein n=1 Tax=Streptomyces xanthophaeus TaxID=67385 RepID=UPI003415038F
MAIRECVRAEDADPARRTRIRRSALAGAVGGAACVAVLGFSFVVQGWELGIAAWITVPLPAVVAVAAAWVGAREGRADGIRQEAVADTLAPGETLLSAYLVRPAPLHPEVPDVWDQCLLQLTTQRLQLWQHTTLLLGRPWSELRVIAHGDDVVIVHGPEGPLVELQVEEPASSEELVLAGARLKARARR